MKVILNKIVVSKLFSKLLCQLRLFNKLKVYFLVFLFSFFMFSPQALEMLDCHIYNSDTEKKWQSDLQSDPNNTSILRTLGMNIICLGRVSEGLSYILQAVDLGDPIAATIISSYYSSDKTFKNGFTTNNLSSFDTAIYYLTKATRLIEQDVHYPKGYDALYESQTYISVRMFVNLANLYYIKYGKNLEGVFATDTLETISYLADVSKRCLSRFPLPIWGERQADVYSVTQTKCQAYLDFTQEVLPLEKSRLHIVNRCEDAQKCPEYPHIMQAILDAFRKNFEKINSVFFEFMY